MVIEPRDHTLLVERYRPDTLEGYVGNENIKKVIKQYLEQNDIQNLLFYGPSGTGKTTLAKIIVKNLDCDFLYINASDERGIETIRDKVSGFASSASFKPIKVVILDEADFLTIQAQASLRNVIETFSRTTRFILTCNFIERIIDPIQSRCQTLKIVPPSKPDIAKHIYKILGEEEVECKPQDVVNVVNKHYPDIRKCLNTIQVSITGGVLNLDESTIVSSNYMTLILKELSKKKPGWKVIKQIIADANVSDFEELYRYIYDNADKFLPGKEGMVAIYINEHQYQSQFAIDKEINCMSLISRLIELK